MADVIYQISPGKGVYSNINGFLAACHLVYSRNDGSELFVDSNGSMFFDAKEFSDYFKVKSVKMLDDAAREKCETLDVRTLGQAKRAFDGTWVLPGEQIESYLQYQDDAMLKINTRIKEINLPQDYICIQVRRGDKVNEKRSWTSVQNLPGEAERYEVEEYIGALLQRMGLRSVPDNWNLFIMTDDYKVIREFEGFKQKHSTNFSMHTLCNKNADGFSISLDLESQRKYSESEMIDLFAEVEIARRANWFVGTFSSNIWRYINRTSDNPAQCLTLDYSDAAFAPSLRRWNAAWKINNES